MHLPSWRQIVARISTWKTGISANHRERRDFARLSLRRLEDRRVLNGTAVGMEISITDAKGAVIVDASQDAGAGNSFDMSLNSNNGKIDLELTDHGTILYEEEINKIASVTFLAAANNQALTIDFANGDPIPTGGVSFVVEGGAQQGLPGDSLQLVNGAAGTVAYSLSNPTSGQVSIDIGSQHSSIAFSGMAQVSDELIAASRSFSIGGAISQVQLTSAGPASGCRNWYVAIGPGCGDDGRFCQPCASPDCEHRRARRNDGRRARIGGRFQCEFECYCRSGVNRRFFGPAQPGNWQPVCHGRRHRSRRSRRHQQWNNRTQRDRTNHHRAQRESFYHGSNDWPLRPADHAAGNHHRLRWWNRVARRRSRRHAAGLGNHRRLVHSCRPHRRIGRVAGKLRRLDRTGGRKCLRLCRWRLGACRRRLPRGESGGPECREDVCRSGRYDRGQCNQLRRRRTNHGLVPGGNLVLWSD